MLVFRYLVLGALIALVYRMLRGCADSFLHQFHPHDSKPQGKARKPAWDLDESQIQDAEFQDLDT